MVRSIKKRRVEDGEKKRMGEKKGKKSAGGKVGPPQVRKKEYKNSWGAAHSALQWWKHWESKRVWVWRMCSMLPVWSMQ